MRTQARRTDGGRNQATDTGGNRRVNRLLDTIPSEGRILDIGCVQHNANAADKDMWVHGHLSDRHEDILGVDYLEDEIQKLQNRGYNVLTADAENLDIGQKFDVIVAGELIEHLSDIGSFLDGVHDHLRPDGKFILTTPNPWAFHRFKQALLNDDVRANDEHTCWFCATTLRQTLDRHGFDAEIEYIGPSETGITSLLYQIGCEAIGGTSLIAVATPVEK